MASISIHTRRNSGAPGESGWSGFSGMAGAYSASGFSGYSGWGGPGPSGPSGASGFSGPSASVYNWTTRAYVSLDESRLGIDTYPVTVPASAELNLALEANQTYVITGTLFTSTATGADTNVFTNWTYTGAVNNFRIGYSESNPASITALMNYWININQIYPPVTPTAWAYLYGGKEIDGTQIVIFINGTIETSTAGVLSYCWLPSDSTLISTVQRGSYIQAVTLGGAASGCSGFSGKTGVVMVGSWLGI